MAHRTTFYSPREDIIPVRSTKRFSEKKCRLHTWESTRLLQRSSNSSPKCHVWPRRMIRQQALYRNRSLLGSQSSGSVRHLGAACPGFRRVPGEASVSTRGWHTAGRSTVPTTPRSLPGPSVKQQEGRETPGGGPLAVEARDRLCPESLNHGNQSDRQTGHRPRRTRTRLPLPRSRRHPWSSSLLTKIGLS